MRALTRSLRAQGRTIAFVPTMGALHAGHLSLVTRARREADVTVVSIFVNPLQFGPREDYARYPRRDGTLLAAAGADVLFTPSARSMYPRTPAVRVGIPELSRGLCGRHRPAHFE